MLSGLPRVRQRLVLEIVPVFVRQKYLDVLLRVFSTLARVMEVSYNLWRKCELWYIWDRWDEFVWTVFKFLSNNASFSKLS